VINRLTALIYIYKTFSFCDFSGTVLKLLRNAQKSVSLIKWNPRLLCLQR